MRDHPLADCFRIDSESNYMDLVPFTDQLTGKLAAPIFQSSAAWIKPLQHQTDSHGHTTKMTFRCDDMRILFTMSRSRSTVPPVSIHPTAVVDSKAELAPDVI